MWRKYISATQDLMLYMYIHIFAQEAFYYENKQEGVLSIPASFSDIFYFILEKKADKKELIFG
jgi:hypothetical protein